MRMRLEEGVREGRLSREEVSSSKRNDNSLSKKKDREANALLELGLEDCVDEIDAQRLFGYALYEDGKNTKLSYPLENFDSNSALVDGLCKAGKPEDAKGVLAEMKNFGLKPDTVTYTSLINFFFRNGQIDEAIELLKEMKENECEADTVTFNVILGGLCREGRFDGALDTIEKLPHQGVYLNKGSYKILLELGLEDCVDEIDAQRLFGYALYEDGKNTKLSYPLENFDSNSALVDGLCKAGKPEDAKGVLAEMKNFGLKPDTVTYTSLINFFFRNGQIDEAIELLKEMKENECEADTVTFNVILGGLCREGRFDGALDTIEKLPHQGVYLNKGSYKILLELGLEDCVDEIDAQRVFGYALYENGKNTKLSYPLENFDSNVYGRSFQGNIYRAKNVIEFMKNNGCFPNVFNYSALVDGLCKAGKSEDAKGVLAEMKNFGLKPDTVTYTSLINFFFRNGQIDEAIELLKEMKENECEADTVTFNVILGGLCREGRFDEALDTIEKLPHQGVYLNKGSYKILLELGLEDCVDEIDAQRVFGYALYEDGKNTKLSYPLENFDSNVYGRSFQGNIDRAKNVIEFMKNNGCCPNVFNYSALVDGLCKAGKPEDAKRVLAEMKNFGLKPDTVTYTSLINFFCRNGQIDEAIELLKEMKENECEADTVTFNVILGGLCREGRFDEALDTIDKLPHQGVYLNKGSYKIVLNSLNQK
ncbi:pentatricopeptide repeat-containing protein At5g18475 [Lathyrus oleraceus]|uniref:pentatricopeptide repeat-containing protein At5g18475 n=1 Tax=Pisum sativum TaxID=3888 RepID=UPI0021D09E9E|nr:pentatricopeptide repeat-containing protein At5g18475-like [Pisum sativum]